MHLIDARKLEERMVKYFDILSDIRITHTTAIQKTTFI